MAAPRLPFLWPMLFRASEQAAPATRNTARRRALHSTPRRTLQSTPRCRQSGVVARRYGQANEPPPYLGGGKGYGPSTKHQQSESDHDAKALPKIGEKLQKDGERQVDEENGSGIEKQDATAATTTEAAQTHKSSSTGDPMFDHPDSPPEKSADSLLDTVMDPIQHEKEGQNTPQSPPPPPPDSNSHPKDSSSIQNNNTTIALSSPRFTEEHAPSLHNHAHIDKPRYVHHFDTYSLVRRLQLGGWTNPQAITIMKSMRLLLGDNLNKASRALVSKSDVENETYLFSAACSELRTEVFARRVALQEQMRMERDQLQHEVDILEQRLGQETMGMKDELRGMFDDRKMAVRNEQRAMESKVQELNYKITVNLQADSKSDVEGVRWVLTRRVILTLGIIVLMVVGSLKLYSNSVHERELEKKRRAKMRHAASQTDDSNGRRGGAGGGGNGEKKGAGGGDVMLVSEGDNPAFVSLG
ncbi:hypothetical protein Q7P37_011032 [Cladosporium fusiforme]